MSSNRREEEEDDEAREDDDELWTIELNNLGGGGLSIGQSVLSSDLSKRRQADGGLRLSNHGACAQYHNISLTFEPLSFSLRHTLSHMAASSPRFFCNKRVI